jgi:aminopeptidase N
MDQLVVEETVPVMWEDGYASSHPLATKVENSLVQLVDKSKIISIFDKITTSKGIAVMRMVESVVGASGFQNGFKVYFINF